MTTHTHEKDVAEVFAERISAASFDDLPADIVDITKRSILDTLGVALAASGCVPEVRALVDVARECGGKSTIWGCGASASATMAAFANGAMTHSLDYDDVIDELGLHLSATTVPAALALAERAGGVSGREFILAVALGNDMITRMAQAISARADWFLTPLLGTFAGAAAGAKVLRLSKEQMVDAFGIAFCQAAGTMEIVHGADSNIRALYDSFVGKAAVLSALMAERGISGVKASMEGKCGLFNAYFHGAYKREVLVGELGRRFEGNKVAFKAWPCCRRAHPALTALIALMRKEAIAGDDIERVLIDTNPASEALCLPAALRQHPATPLEAKFSIPYILAVAMRKGRVGLEDFDENAIKDARTIEFAQKVSPRPNADYAATPGMTPGKVELRTKSGRVYTYFEDYSYGHPKNPLGDDDLLHKFRDCVRYAAVPIARADTDKLARMLFSLESVQDMRHVAHLLGGPVAGRGEREYESP